MNEEIMEMDQVTEETQPEGVEEEQSGIGTGIAMLIGAGLTVAGIAAVKYGRKAIGKIKSMRKASKIEGNDEVIDAEIIESEDSADE